MQSSRSVAPDSVAAFKIFGSAEQTRGKRLDLLPITFWSCARHNMSSLVRNVPGVTSIEVSPFWAVGDGPGFLFCKWFLPCCRRLSGRWESGNPAFGFPVFHGPTVSNSCFLFPILESVVGAVGMWKSRLLCEISKESFP